MTPEFNACDPATWPLALSAEQMAVIYQRAVGGLKQACQKGSFVPAPFQKQPYRWRRAEVIRHLEGARTPAGLRRVG